MAEEPVGVPGGEITDNDKLMAALSYPIWIVGLIILLTESKERPFQKYHAVLSLALNVVVWALVIVLSCGLSLITAPLGGFGACITPFILLAAVVILLYYAYLAYQGQYFEIPVLSDFCKNQGWI